MLTKDSILLITVLVLFVLPSLSYGASAIVAINSCYGENLSTVKESFTLACSAGKLIYNDTLNITFDYKKQGPVISYAGIRTVNNDSTVTNCSSISNVQICYSWWTSDTHTDTCVISVDNTGNNGTWINFTRACPLTSKPSSITCVNVTSNETWVCSNFFGASGTRARIQSEIGGHGPQESVFLDVLYYNVTYNTAANVPVSNMPNNQTVKIQTLSNITWTVNTSLAAGHYYVHRNGTLFAGPLTWANNIPFNISANNTELGKWNYTLYFNDSAGTNGIPISVFITVINSSRVVSCSALIIPDIVYTLQNNLSAASNNCITIEANNVTFDGNGFMISNSGTADNGIYANNIINVTIRNVTITGFSSNGIYFSSVNISYITGVNSSLNGDVGIYIYNTSYSNITNSEVNNNAKGIKFESSRSNSISNNRVHKNKYGVYLTNDANSNKLVNNNMNSNGDNGSSVYLNASSNNIIKGGLIKNSLSAAIYNTNLSRNNFTDIDISNTASSEDISLGSVGLNGAWFIDIKNIGLYNFSGDGQGSIINFENTENGSVIFNEPVKSSGDNLSADLQIKNNYVFVNSSKDKNWNISANITLYNLPTNFINPVILRNGNLCTADACINFTDLNAGNVSFSVTGWSSYSIGEMLNESEVTSNSSNAIANSALPSNEIPGGYAPKTYLVVGSDFLNGYSNRMLANDKYRFVLGNKNYTLTLNSFNFVFAKITINPSAMGAYLAKGEKIALDVDNDDIDDVLLKYNKSDSGKAVLFIQDARKTYQSPETNETFDNNTINISIDYTVNDGSTANNSSYILWVPADLLVIIAFITIVFFLKNHHKKWHRWFD